MIEFKEVVIAGKKYCEFETEVQCQSFYNMKKLDMHGVLYREVGGEYRHLDYYKVMKAIKAQKTTSLARKNIESCKAQSAQVDEDLVALFECVAS